MNKGRNNNPGDSDKNDARKKRIDACKYFGRLTYERVNRPHSTQDHCRIDECVQPLKMIKAMVTDDANSQRDQRSEKRTGTVPRDTFREMAATDKFLTSAFIHDTRFYS